MASAVRNVIGASAASPVLARSMPTVYVYMSSTDQSIAHAQKLARHMFVRQLFVFNKQVIV